MNVNKVYELIIEYGIATEGELQLATNLNGLNMKTLNDVIYVQTGYRDMKQYLEDNGGE